MIYGRKSYTMIEKERFLMPGIENLERMRIQRQSAKKISLILYIDQNNLLRNRREMALQPLNVIHQLFTIRYS